MQGGTTRSVLAQFGRGRFLLVQVTYVTQDIQVAKVSQLC